jgi:O-antigen/teichoic acid export membrane protein
VGARLAGALLLAGWSLARIMREFGVPDFQSLAVLPWGYNLNTFWYQVANWMVNYLDRFLILAFLPASGMGSVGVYEFAIKCMIPLELLLNGLGASLSPRVVRLLSEQTGSKGSTPEVNRYFYGLLVVMMMAIGIMLAVLPPAFNLLVHKEGYYQALDYVPFIAVLFLFRSWRLFFVIPLSALKRTGRLAIVTLLVAAVKAAGIAVLLPAYNLYGVIVAALMAGAAELLLLWALLRPYFKLQFNAVKLLVAPLVFGVAVVLTYAFDANGMGWQQAALLMGIAVLLLAVAYRKEWHLLLSLLREQFFKAFR